MRVLRATLAMLFAISLLGVSGCRPNPLTSAEVAKLTAQVSRDYPGWAIERVYTQANQGLMDKGATASVVLRLPGTQDSRVRLTFYYGFAPGNRDWTHSNPSLLQDPKDAADFFNAFRARHPEPGLIVDIQGARIDSTAAAVRAAGPQGLRFVVDYWTAQNFAASNGSLDSGQDHRHAEQWTAVATSHGIDWTY